MVPGDNKQVTIVDVMMGDMFVNSKSRDVDVLLDFEEKMKSVWAHDQWSMRNLRVYKPSLFVIIFPSGPQLEGLKYYVFVLFIIII